MLPRSPPWHCLRTLRRSTALEGEWNDGDRTNGDSSLSALTKAKMADQLFDELGLNKREAKEMVELFFDEILQSLENNVQVKLSGFGNFDLREKGERPGRNPKTGEEIPITARRVVTFDPQKLKSRVEAFSGERGKFVGGEDRLSDEY